MCVCVCVCVHAGVYVRVCARACVCVFVFLHVLANVFGYALLFLFSNVQGCVHVCESLWLQYVWESVCVCVCVCV